MKTKRTIDDIKKLVIEQFSNPDGRIFKRFNNVMFESLVREKNIDGIIGFLFQEKESLETITTRELMVAAGEDKKGAFIYLQRLMNVKTNRICGIERIIVMCQHLKKEM